MTVFPNSSSKQLTLAQYRLLKELVRALKLGAEETDPACRKQFDPVSIIGPIVERHTEIPVSDRVQVIYLMTVFLETLSAKTLPPSLQPYFLTPESMQ